MESSATFAKPHHLVPRQRSAAYRYVHGFGSHTYSFVNAANERFWVKFHFKTQQRITNLTEAGPGGRRPRERHQRDLLEAIGRGDFPKWTLYVQVMADADAENLPYHPFDLTKVWPMKDYPLIEVGVMGLNRNPENFSADVEQSACVPNNLVPGIGVSPDRMLQARLFAYSDAQRYCLGVNHHQIPVNTARCPVYSNHRDRAMLADGDYGGTLHCEPYSFGQWQEQPGYREPPLGLRGGADFCNFREDDAAYYKRLGDLFRLMKPEQRQALFANTARAMVDERSPEFIKRRHIDNCTKAGAA